MSKEVKLSPREIEVIKAFMDGSTYKEVATKLGIAESTVGQHNYSSYKKMGFRNIVEAINYVNKMEFELMEEDVEYNSNVITDGE